jgi:hypothetical protein
MFRGRGVLAATRNLEVLRFSRVQRTREVNGILIDKLAVIEQVRLDMDAMSRFLAVVRRSPENRGDPIVFHLFHARQHNVLDYFVSVQCGRGLLSLFPHAMHGPVPHSIVRSSKGDRKPHTEEKSPPDEEPGLQNGTIRLFSTHRAFLGKTLTSPYFYMAAARLSLTSITISSLTADGGPASRPVDPLASIVRDPPVRGIEHINAE